ncbi:hypothetical protein DSOUD_1551 [Desulfuromonas soudanensis]|uniref:Zinc ribbon domain-containing protein n=1 Tax=Desulfuromonas soudanensis TaxID=1603606 RepID=A0A0M4D910_9BACT|nr:hypothetical protein [Desulfuromonas soudanensis]ALC16330.1 hypothetical protein DSOUD_1551 [Desulfuromonas soudanensis]
MRCPKCGFDFQETGAVACPKCGVVFAKVQRVAAAEAAFKQRTAAEISICEGIQKEMERDEKIRFRLSFGPDPEYARDEAAYPVTLYLSGAFAFLAAFTTITEIMGLVHFYQWGKLIFDPREMFFFMFSLAVASAGSVSMLLAISEGLRMARDVANNSRATREYSRMITVKRKE